MVTEFVLPEIEQTQCLLAYERFKRVEFFHEPFRNLTSGGYERPIIGKIRLKRSGKPTGIWIGLNFHLQWRITERESFCQILRTLSYILGNPS